MNTGILRRFATVATVAVLAVACGGTLPRTERRPHTRRPEQARSHDRDGRRQPGRGDLVRRGRRRGVGGCDRGQDRQHIGADRADVRAGHHQARRRREGTARVHSGSRLRLTRSHQLRRAPCPVPGRQLRPRAADPGFRLGEGAPRWHSIGRRRRRRVHPGTDATAAWPHPRTGRAVRLQGRPDRHSSVLLDREDHEGAGSDAGAVHPRRDRRARWHGGPPVPHLRRLQETMPIH